MVTRVRSTSLRAPRRGGQARPSGPVGPTIAAAMLVVLLAGLFAYVVKWRLETRPEPARYGIVIDRSNSYLLDCRQVRARARAYMAAAPDIEGSTLLVLATSTKERDFEPELLLEERIAYFPPTPTGNPEQDQDELRERLAQSIESACEQLEIADNSPIRRAVERAVQHLHSRPGGGVRHLTVMTDLEERVDDLDGALPPIENRFEIVFCGATNRGQLGKSAVDMINAEAAMRSQFNGPVRFEPFCSATVSVTAAAR